MTAVLNEQVHARLIQNIDNICAVANIPKAMLDESATNYCNQTEVEWLRKFPIYQRQNKGLLLLGKHFPGPDVKMMAMSAALIRNYVDSRVLTVQTLLDAQENTHEVPEPTVLMIPNLFVRQAGKGLPAWKMQILYDILLSRFVAGKLTVAYVENKSSLESEYGIVFSQHLESNYVLSQG